MMHYHIHEFFDDLVFSTDVGLRKPNPKMFKIALSNVGAEADCSYFVGNNLQATSWGRSMWNDRRSQGVGLLHAR